MQLSEITIHNQTVGIASDPSFRGYVWGESTPADPVLGTVMLVYVKEPGATGRKGCTLIPVAELVAVKVRR